MNLHSLLKCVVGSVNSLRDKNISMQTIDQLFSNEMSIATFHDAVLEATGKTNTYEELRQIFNKLSTATQNIAHCWGLEDTVFRDEAYVELKGRG